MGTKWVSSGGLSHMFTLVLYSLSLFIMFWPILDGTIIIARVLAKYLEEESNPVSGPALKHQICFSRWGNKFWCSETVDNCKVNGDQH